MNQKSKCGCVLDSQNWGGIPMTEIIKECDKHKAARIEALKKRRQEREARKK